MRQRAAGGRPRPARDLGLLALRRAHLPRRGAQSAAGGGDRPVTAGRWAGRFAQRGTAPETARDAAFRRARPPGRLPRSGRPRPPADPARRGAGHRRAPDDARRPAGRPGTQPGQQVSALAAGDGRPFRTAHHLLPPRPLGIPCPLSAAGRRVRPGPSNPPAPAVRAGQRAPHGEVLRVPGGHYAPFLAAHEQVVEAELSFLRRHLLDDAEADSPASGTAATTSHRPA